MYDVSSTSCEAINSFFSPLSPFRPPVPPLLSSLLPYLDRRLLRVPVHVERNVLANGLDLMVASAHGAGEGAGCRVGEGGRRGGVGEEICEGDFCSVVRGSYERFLELMT